MAAAEVLEVIVRGHGGHASQPHRAADPIAGACEIVTALQTMVTRRFDVFDPVIITVGSFHAGTTDNVIPDQAHFLATVRSFSPGARERVRAAAVTLIGDIAAAHAEAMAPFERTVGENPYTVHAEVQQTMSRLVGIIRKENEIKTALADLEKLRERAALVRAEGGPAYNPGWHLALDLRNIMLIAECVAQAALERQESRGGHTRDDFPGMSPEWRKVNLICSELGGRVTLRRQPMEPMREDLLALFDRAELKKYLTEEELPPAPEETN